jgi:hypothetical protein
MGLLFIKDFNSGVKKFIKKNINFDAYFWTDILKMVWTFVGHLDMSTRKTNVLWFF